MAQTPAWFKEAYYLQQKLAQLQATDPDGHWTPYSLNQALEAAGLTPLQHFELYGNDEGLGPNPYFKVAEYLQAKANRLNADSTPAPDGAGRWTMELVQQAIDAAGLTAWTHFQKYGWQENVNPSNDFSVNGYLAAKAVELNAQGSMTPDGKAWTVDSMAAAFLAIGIDPVDHYYSYGRTEGIAVTPVPAEEWVVPGGDPDVKPDPAPDPGPGPGPTPATLTLTAQDDFLAPDASGKDSRTTSLDDTINGATAALPGDNTLNPGDRIDGGGGSDTLNVNMSAGFSGFSGVGYLKNVENVNLTNAAAGPHTFSAAGISGVENYTLNGQISLTDLASTAAAVSINNIADTAAIGLGFAADAVKGATDALTVGINSLGTAAVTGTAPVAQKTVTITADGIETLNVNTTGDNFVALAGDTVTAINVTGEGKITTTVAANTKNFDASGHAGTVHVALGNVSAESVRTGAGDDVITANVAALKIAATIDGGAGTDTLVLAGAAGGASSSYHMSNIETLGLGVVGGPSIGAFTFSASNASGSSIQTIHVNNLGFGVALTAMGARDLTFNLNDHGGVAQTVTSDHAGTTSMHAVASSTAPIRTGVDVNESTSMTLNVDAGTVYEGQINAAKATTIEVSGHVQGTVINAATADSAVLNTTGASSLILTTAGLATLNATLAAGKTGDGLDLTGSSLTNLNSLTATIGVNTALTIGNLANAGSLTLTGTGTATVGNLGSDILSQDITVAATGLKGLEIGTMDTGADQSVTVRAEGMSGGGVTLGDITVADNSGAHSGSINVRINGTTGNIELGKLTASSVVVNAADAAGIFGPETTFTIDADTAIVDGVSSSANQVNVFATKGGNITTGTGDDTITINGAADTGGRTDFTVKTGSGSDSVSVLTDAGLTVVTITDFAVGIDNAVAVGALSASITDKATAATYLSGLTGTTVAETSVRFISTGFVEYAGATYGIISGDPDCGDGDVVVRLAGVTNATTADVGAYFTSVI